MRIGVPKELQDQEYRVGMMPSSVRELIARGHTVLGEKGAGIDIGFSDEILSCLHLAADPVQADLLLTSGCVAIAYETVTDDQGGLPLLTPMSEIAGRLSIQAGAHCNARWR